MNFLYIQIEMFAHRFFRYNQMLSSKIIVYDKLTDFDTIKI